jgi:hypothetical protein
MAAYNNVTELAGWAAFDAKRTTWKTAVTTYGSGSKEAREAAQDCMAEIEQLYTELNLPPAV